MNSRNKIILQVMTFLVTGMVVTQANRAVMNPLHPIDIQVNEEVSSEEISSQELKAEPRSPPTASEVMALLAEDETRQGNSSKHQSDGSKMDCSKITMQIFQVLLQNPDSVEPEDYSCGLLNLISHFEKSAVRMRSLETSLYTATNTIRTLESSLQAEMSKTQFLVKELNETVHKETERAIKAENVIARRVLSEKSRVDNVQKNLTEILGTSMQQIKEFEVTMKELEHTVSSPRPPVEKNFTTLSHPALSLLPPIQMTPMSSLSLSEQDYKKIEVKISSLQQFIQDLSNRITHMEDGSEEHVNKGITQIFKTYASLANEIEKETERATGEEKSIKNLIASEIASVGKQITTLQERITEEKNRVQVIENRRTADLFEEINRAKTEEGRIGQKLKDEMSKAAAAFKRLEVHVDTQLNSTKGFDDLKSVTDTTTRRVSEVEEKLAEQIKLEHARALAVESALKIRVDTETQRAMTAENEMRAQYTEEKDRVRTAQKELKVAIDTEVQRATSVEFSLSNQMTIETERSKQVELQLHEHINGNISRLLTDIIKEFTRAQNAEMELANKISAEVYRATSAEQSLLENINGELTRATDKEQQLFYLFKTHENSTKLVDECKSLIETETSRARTVETNLEIKIHNEASRARNTEEKMANLMSEGFSRAKEVEVNVTQTSAEILRHTKELELEVRKTVMAEVARAVDAENGLKQQIFTESERARSVEHTLAHGQSGNYSEISSRMQEIIREVEKDSLRLEDISLQISRNLTGDILTLAELFDDKLDDLERSENVRLKKIEDDMKKCCSGSSWRWRTPKGKSANGSAAGTVINKLMQVFGAVNEDAEVPLPTPPTKKRSGNKGNNRKGESNSGRSLDSIDNFSADTESEQYLDDDTSAKLPVAKESSHVEQLPTKVFDHETNQTVVYIHAHTVTDNDDIAAALPENIKVPRKKPIRSSRRVSSISNVARNSDVAVQNANSKVTSTFG